MLWDRPHELEQFWSITLRSKPLLLQRSLSLRITGDTSSSRSLKAMDSTLGDYVFLNYPLRPHERMRALFPAPKLAPALVRMCPQKATSAGLWKSGLLPEMYYLAITYFAKTCFTVGSSQLGLIEEPSPVNRFSHRLCGALARILSSFSSCSLV